MRGVFRWNSEYNGECERKFQTDTKCRPRSVIVHRSVKCESSLHQISTKIKEMMHITETCVVVNGTSTKRYDEMDGSFLYHRSCSSFRGCRTPPI
jgi:hypothetical protein